MEVNEGDLSREFGVDDLIEEVYEDYTSPCPGAGGDESLANSVRY